jgi:hypothetical protein
LCGRLERSSSPSKADFCAGRRRFLTHGRGAHSRLDLALQGVHLGARKKGGNHG